MVADSQSREKINQLLVDPHDLGTLKPKAGHQTFLIEGKSVDAAMQRVSRKATGHSFVYDHDARAAANFPAARVVYPVHSLLVHQKKGITIFLNASLQSIGGSYSPIATSRLTVREKDSLPPCAPMMNPAFTTSGNTRTASAFDLALAAAGFCATSCCRARRESLIRSADAVPVVSNVTAASIEGIRICFIGFIVYNGSVDVDPIFVVPTAMRLWQFRAIAGFC